MSALIIAGLAALYGLWYRRFAMYPPYERRGPFRYSRHPKLFFLWLVYLAAVTFVGEVLVLGAFLLVSAPWIRRTIKREDTERRARYGQNYVPYCYEVSAFFPQIWRIKRRF